MNQSNRGVTISHKLIVFFISSLFIISVIPRIKSLENSGDTIFFNESNDTNETISVDTFDSLDSDDHIEIEDIPDQYSAENLTLIITNIDNNSESSNYFNETTNINETLSVNTNDTFSMDTNDSTNITSPFDIGNSSNQCSCDNDTFTIENINESNKSGDTFNNVDNNNSMIINDTNFDTTFIEVKSLTESRGAIWTTRNDCGNVTQDVNLFNFGDEVYINGQGFNSNTTYNWNITGKPGSCDPNLIVASGTLTTNNIGSFCINAYTIQPNDCGTYQVKVENKGDNFRVNVSYPPVVEDIPNQTVAEGVSFASINLDDYVLDIDNLVSEMVWTYSGNSELSVDIDVDRVATVTIPSADWFGSEVITFRATDPGDLWDEDAATFTIIFVNDPPNAPTNPNPDNNITNVPLTTVLNVSVSDPNGDTMNVYFYNAANNSLIGTAFSVSNNSNASIVWSNLSYNTLYKWYVIVNDSFLENISDIWSFTTTFRSSLGDTSNQYPVADANGPYYGFINEEIEFNASGSIDNDGLIINYTWYFGDGVKGFGIKTTHIYDQFGEYTITLTVMDNNGAINTDKTLAVIRHPNRPPTIPVINGTINGTKNTYYNYTARSTDLDDDAIQYIFDWGDGNKISSEFLANGTLTIQTHSWTIAGKYIITVIAYDNYTYSEIASFIVLIDAHIVGEIGYITDDDTDGTYDTFHTANLETPLEREEDNYLIDSDGDNKRDYVYNLETGLITYFDYVYKKCFNLYQTTSKTPGFEMISVLLMIILVFIILRRRKLYE